MRRRGAYRANTPDFDGTANDFMRERLTQQAIIVFAALLVIYPVGWLLYASATPGGLESG